MQLLNIVRDNQVVIVVGETGSGKTTQLTQVRKNVNRSTRKQRRCEVLNELTSENILIFNVSCKVGNVPLFGLYVLKKNDNNRVGEINYFCVEIRYLRVAM